MNIITYPNPILREQMPVFDFKNPVTDPIQLEKDMLTHLYANDGIGLAANQIGVRANVFVMGHRDSPENGTAFFNPEVVGVSEDFAILEEGCLSFPGIFVKIKRPTRIKARWQNAHGEITEGEFEGYECKCFLHELDHLLGVTMRDRIRPLKWGMSVKKSKRMKY
jgi:peptide deformylase